jgi:hypothetical protein
MTRKTPAGGRPGLNGQEEFLRNAFVSVEVNADFSQAVLTMADGSRLQFQHQVGQRRALAVGPGTAVEDLGLSGHILNTIAMFRLNGKHLDVQFTDGTRWEARFSGTQKRNGDEGLAGTSS